MPKRQKTQVSHHLYQPRKPPVAEEPVPQTAGPSPKKVTGCSERLAGTKVVPYAPKPPIVPRKVIPVEDIQKNVVRLHDRPVEKLRQLRTSAADSHPPEGAAVIGATKMSEEAIADTSNRLYVQEMTARQKRREKLAAKYLKKIHLPNVSKSPRPASSPQELVSRLYVGGLEKQKTENNRLESIYTPRREATKLDEGTIRSVSDRLSTPRK